MTAPAENKKSFTPGPWRNYRQGNGTGQMIETEARDEFVRSLETIARIPLEFHGSTEANSQLISASPDLFAALAEAIEDAERQIRADAPGVAPHWYTQATSAIQKATGGAA